MPVELPNPIAAYFAADGTTDAEAVADCFAADALVKDEGRTHAGRDAIREWKHETSAKYRYTVAPIAIASEDDRTIVTSRLAGDFPGSPLDLRYVFRLAGDKIAELEIAA